MKTFLFVFLLVIISSCHTETGDYIPVRSLDLSSCEKIVYQEIVVKDYLLSYPTGIFLIDGKLVIKMKGVSETVPCDNKRWRTGSGISPVG